MSDGSETILQYAKEAKQFMIQAGEGVIRDELIMRAAVTYGMLERRGLLTKPTDLDIRLLDDVMNRAFAIALIASNFDDDPPSTRHRAVLFSHQITTTR